MAPHWPQQSHLKRCCKEKHDIDIYRTFSFLNRGFQRTRRSRWFEFLTFQIRLWRIKGLIVLDMITFFTTIISHWSIQSNSSCSSSDSLFLCHSVRWIVPVELKSKERERRGFLWSEEKCKREDEVTLLRKREKKTACLCMTLKTYLRSNSWDGKKKEGVQEKERLKVWAPQVSRMFVTYDLLHSTFAFDFLDLLPISSNKTYIIHS